LVPAPLIGKYVLPEFHGFGASEAQIKDVLAWMIAKD
jgi:hypothetical protein